MAILSLYTVSFRNLSSEKIDTDAKDVFLIGENGQGKSNFLEALYFCSYASSFRGSRDGEMAKNGETDFSAIANIGLLNGESVSGRHDHLFLQISVKVEKSKKTVMLDGKKITDRKDLLDTIPLVVFCHEDMEFVSGSQERRRWFFDQTQSLYDPVYLDDLRRYRHVLKTRNAVLREIKLGFAGSKNGGDYQKDRLKAAELLDALDPQLVEYGLRLMEKRQIAAERFSLVFGSLYREVAGINGIYIHYEPSWKKSLTSEDIVKQLTERRSIDSAQAVTLSGPHRDKYIFVLKDSIPRRFSPLEDFSRNASTGQRRLLALLLRIAQARCFSDLTGKAPVLLLDDVLLELDGEKRRRFLSVMPGYEQAFFTFLPEEPYKNYVNSGTLVYNVKNGVIK